MSNHVFKEFRTKHGITQTDLGKKLGLEPFPQGRISHYETGTRPVPVDVAQDFIQLAASYGDAYTLESVYPVTSAA